MEKRVTTFNSRLLIEETKSRQLPAFLQRKKFNETIKNL
jgi:hypothetical protein